MNVYGEARAAGKRATLAINRAMECAGTDEAEETLDILRHELGTCLHDILKAETAAGDTGDEPVKHATAEEYTRIIRHIVRCERYFACTGLPPQSETSAKWDPSTHQPRTWGTGTTGRARWMDVWCEVVFFLGLVLVRLHEHNRLDNWCNQGDKKGTLRPDTILRTAILHGNDMDREQAVKYCHATIPLLAPGSHGRDLKLNELIALLAERSRAYNDHNTERLFIARWLGHLCEIVLLTGHCAVSDMDEIRFIINAKFFNAMLGSIVRDERTIAVHAVQAENKRVRYLMRHDNPDDTQLHRAMRGQMVAMDALFHQDAALQIPVSEFDRVSKMRKRKRTVVVEPSSASSSPTEESSDDYEDSEEPSPKRK